MRKPLGGCLMLDSVLIQLMYSTGSNPSVVFICPSVLICSEKFCVILWYKRKGRILFIHVHLLWVINPNYVGIEWSWYDVWVSCGYGRNHGHL